MFSTAMRAKRRKPKKAAPATSSEKREHDVELARALASLEEQVNRVAATVTESTRTLGERVTGIEVHLRRTRPRRWPAAVLAIFGIVGGALFANVPWAAHVAGQEAELEVTGGIERFLTYQYPADPRGFVIPDSDFRVVNVSVPLADLPNGSLYMLNRTLKNTGASVFHDLVIGLNLPGVPVVTYSDREDALIDVQPVAVRMLRFNQADDPVEIAVRDPRLLRPPTFAAERGIDFFLERELIGGVSGYVWRGNETVIGANGTQTAWYRLGVLRPGETWTMKTIYFGAVNDDFAAEVITATRDTFDRVPRPQSTVIPTFGPDAADVDTIWIVDWDNGGAAAGWRSVIPFWN